MPSPTTIILKQPPTFREYLIIAVVVVLAILFIRSCHGSDTLRTAALQKEDSIQAQKKQITQLRNDSLRIVTHLRDSAAKLHTIDSNEIVHFIADARGWASRNQELVTYIASIKPQHADTMGYVLVPMDYPDSCTACANSLKTAFKGIDSLKDLADKTNELVTYELLIREKAAVIQERYSDSLQSLFNAQSQVVTALAKASKVRNSLWLGCEGSYNPVYSSVGGMVSYQLKQGKQLTIGAGLTTNRGIYYSVKAAFKISFRK